MIEILEEMVEYLAIFNLNGTEVKKLAFDKDGEELPTADGEFANFKNLNSGAMGNALEYERRLARFIATQLRLDLAQNFYLDDYAGGNLDITRPAGFTDEEYRAFVEKKVLGVKESARAIEFILQEFSSIPVEIFENNSYLGTGFFGISYYGFYETGVVRDDDVPVAPALNGGSSVDGTGKYLYRVRLQPIDEVAERIILILLDAATVAGVRYEVVYEFTPPWH